MNDISTIHQLLAQSYPNLLPRWQELQLTWLSAQAQKRQENQLTQYVMGTLSPKDAQEIENFIAMDKEMAQLVDELQKLYTHFLQVDKEMEKPVAKPIPPHLLNRQGLFGWRGGEEFLQLPVKPFYSFDVMLFLLDGIAHQKRSIRGQLIGRESNVDLNQFNGAKVWLIPPYAGKSDHPQGAVVENGGFRLRSVLAGMVYTFEMAWGQGEFLEVMNVMIPTG